MNKAEIEDELMESNPKVSVIITTYNRAAWLQDAIKSALNQTFKDFEIIVVDDGSTDDTREIIKKYGHQVKYVYQEHRGNSAALNRGIKEAQGTYIAILDSDDIWYPQKLERQVNVIESTGAGLVHTGRYQVDTINKTPPILLPLIPARNSRDFLSGKTHISMTVLVKKNVFDKAGLFDENLGNSQDTEMWLRVAKHEEVIFIDEPLMDCRIHGGNLSLDMDDRYACRTIISRKMLRDQDKRIPKSIWKNKLAVDYYLLASERYKKRRYADSVKFVLKALQANFFVGSLSMNPFIGWVAIKSSGHLPIRVKKFFNPFVLLAKSLLKSFKQALKPISI